MADSEVFSAEPERWWAMLQPGVDAPDISVSLQDFDEMDSVVGYAIYSHGEEACAYDLILSERSGEDLRVRQRPKSETCSWLGTILLWQQGLEALVGQ